MPSWSWPQHWLACWEAAARRAQLLSGSALGCLLVGLLTKLPASDDGARPTPAVNGLAPRLELLAGLPLLAATLILAFVRLGEFPGMRYDETVFLQFSANWVRHGQLAIRLGEELSPALWNAGTGPAVLLPAALLMDLFGIDLAVARLVAGGLPVSDRGGRLPDREKSLGCGRGPGGRAQPALAVGSHKHPHAW